MCGLPSPAFSLALPPHSHPSLSLLVVVCDSYKFGRKVMWVDRLEQLGETLYVDQLDIPEEVKRCACVRACVRPYVHVCMWCLCNVCGVFRICKSCVCISVCCVCVSTF